MSQQKVTKIGQDKEGRFCREFLQRMSIRDRTIPVFIYPTELTFYVSNQTHKQLLTLYNPYDFAVKYQVFANTTDKYGVVDPKGTISPHSYVDLLVRHNAPNKANCYSKDKFMITMQDATTSQILGKRCVLATLLPGDKESSNVDESLHSSYTECESSSSKEKATVIESKVIQYFIVFLFLVALVVLILPTQCDERENSSIPSYLHVSVLVKIVIGYVLGVFSVVYLFPKWLLEAMLSVLS